MSAHHRIPRLLGYTVMGIRYGVSIAFAAAPAKTMTQMFGSPGTSPAARLAARHYVVRDLALGAGLQRALHQRRHAAKWMLAGTVADLIDLGAIVATHPDRRIRNRLALGMTAVVATDTVIGVLLRDDAPSPAE
ncbi:hypothetical protein ACGFWI_25285 [Streptomyces sp. NPDC048434]|uniref:hypothetical protein n=1 Tax=Streptomyces sp. NPDC048434 TaxID=3365549 RepID=UPI00371F40E0